MDIKNVTHKVYRYAKKTYVDIRIELDETDKWDTVESLKARLDRNILWMASHLCNWADFDHQYSIELFVDSLQALGRGLTRWNNVVGAERNGRRALTAAAMLKRAYTHESYNDASYKNWASKNRHMNVPITINGLKMIEMRTLHVSTNAMGMDPKEYSNKMWKIIHARQEKVEAEMKKEAWAYLHKYIECWWD